MLVRNKSKNMFRISGCEYLRAVPANPIMVNNPSKEVPVLVRGGSRNHQRTGGQPASSTTP
jgi:hypothetical protein